MQNQTIPTVICEEGLRGRLLTNSLQEIAGQPVHIELEDGRID